MSPTRRDLLKLSAGAVAAVLASNSVVATEAPVEQAPVTWSITAPIMLDCSDGRRVCAIFDPEQSIVNLYGPGNNHDYDTIWLPEESSRRLHGFVSAVAAGIAAGLEDEGAW